MPIIDELNKSDSSSGSSTSESSSPEYKFYFGLVEEDRDYTENLPILEEISNTVGEQDIIDKKKKRTRKTKQGNPGPHLEEVKVAVEVTTRQNH